MEGSKPGEFFTVSEDWGAGDVWDPYLAFRAEVGLRDPAAVDASDKDQWVSSVVELRPEDLDRYPVYEWREPGPRGVEQRVEAIVIPAGQARVVNGVDVTLPVVDSGVGVTDWMPSLEAGRTVWVHVGHDGDDEVGSWLQERLESAGFDDVPDLAGPVQTMGHRWFVFDGDRVLRQWSPCVKSDEALDWLEGVARARGLSSREVVQRVIIEGPDSELAVWLYGELTDRSIQWNQELGESEDSRSAESAAGLTPTTLGWSQRSAGERSYFDPEIDAQVLRAEVGQVRLELDPELERWMGNQDRSRGGLSQGSWSVCSRTDVAVGSCADLSAVRSCSDDGRSSTTVCRLSPNELYVVAHPGHVTEVVVRHDVFDDTVRKVRWREWVAGSFPAGAGDPPTLTLTAPEGWTDADDAAKLAATGWTLRVDEPGR